MAHTSTSYHDWSWACDSYGKVRHSRKACVYTVIMAPGGERSVNVASRIENWDDAKLIAAAPALLEALRGFVNEYDTDPGSWPDEMVALLKAGTDAIRRAEEGQ